MDEMIKNLGHVVVLYGGNSSEREVSIMSGENIFNALKAAGVQCSLVDAVGDITSKLQSLRPDLVFIALHGPQGEDGTIQGLLEIMNIPYTGCGVQSSALMMDKYRTKLVWKALGLPTPDFCTVRSPDNIPKDHPFPCFVKANCQGSTIGTFPVKKREDVREAIIKSLQYGEEVLIEQWIEGREFSVPILFDKALPAVHIKAASGFYDYEAKYELDTTQYIIPCGLSESKEYALLELAKTAFHVLGGSNNWGRVDFMEDAQGKCWLIEVNTVPGMTLHSIMPQSAKAAGIHFQDLILAIAAGKYELKNS